MFLVPRFSWKWKRKIQQVENISDAIYSTLRWLGESIIFCIANYLLCVWCLENNSIKMTSIIILLQITFTFQQLLDEERKDKDKQKGTQQHYRRRMHSFESREYEQFYGFWISKPLPQCCISIQHFTIICFIKKKKKSF